MSAVELEPQPYMTYDVVQNGRVRGSVWRFRHGWVAFTPHALRTVDDTIYEDIDDAVAVIAKRLRPERERRALTLRRRSELDSIGDSYRRALARLRRTAS